MPTPISLFNTQLALSDKQQGKVRDIYPLDEQHLLIVTTDRISAFDQVLPTAIPGKGKILTSISHFWFDKTRTILPNHCDDITATADQWLNAKDIEQIDGRYMIVKRLKPLPIEAIVRGYLVGSGWKDYQRSGTVCGIQLPSGLNCADQLPKPLYTPSTKAAIGDHDENISFADTVNLLGQERAEQVRDASLEIYQLAQKIAHKQGIIIADTKFEFGEDQDGTLHLIDEVLTPDSSRFWPLDQYQPGSNPPSFDKQFIRDYLEDMDWNKQPPAPILPDEIVEKTRQKYQEAEQRLLSHS
jgi:phosphoribosylaminoimidazole-succinocarboxamide synthase